MNILIVEDSLTQAQHLEHILELSGYTIVVATNGEEALSKLDSVNPALVISDVVMPGIDGYEFCKRIRLNPHFNKLPIILLTTLSDTEDVIQGLECGANYFITKPYENKYLIKYVDTILNTQKLRQSEQDNDGVKVIIHGKKYSITAEKSQILDLLISIYDAAVQKNNQLLESKLQFQELNNILEKKVEERTAALHLESEERKHYEKQFFQAQKMESIGQLAGGIAHDFNNLLMIIQSNLEVLREDQQGDKDNIQRIDDSLSAVKQGADLIQRLMSFSRRQQLQPTLSDLKEIVINTVTLMKPMLGAAIKINLNISENLWPVWLEAGQLENALVNLAINARDAMNGKGTLTIEINNISQEEITAQKNKALHPGDYVCISITDNGPGIPSEVIDHVFEPFFTTKEVGRGTGLGLSMVYGFIKQSSGQITIQSEVNYGTSVNLYLPKANSTPVIEKEKTFIKLSEGGKRILIIDDDEHLIKYYNTLLKDKYKVIAALGGQAALDLLIKDKGQFDVILVDLNMPGINGADIYNHIAYKYPGQEKHILFVTGGAYTPAMEEFLSTMANPILKKPFSSKELLATIDKHLQEV